MTTIFFIIYLIITTKITTKHTDFVCIKMKYRNARPIFYRYKTYIEEEEFIR